MGNLLADVVRGEELKAQSEGFQRGVECHRMIDGFTDAHAVVKRSKGRIGPQYRRVAGILVDLFYDHFLARHWEEFSDETLEDFIEGLREQVSSRDNSELPFDARDLIQGMIRERRLLSYREIEGIETAFERLSWRWEARSKRAISLRGASVELVKNQEGLENDFLEFFPEVRKQVSTSVDPRISWTEMD